jgi:hypothetical protein
VLKWLTFTTQSWYNRTWPRKPAPITQVARESISSASNTASQVVSAVKISAKPKTKRSPSLQLTLGKAKSNRASPIDATTTKVNAESRGSISSPSKSDEAASRKAEDQDLQDDQRKGGYKRHKNDKTDKRVKDGDPLQNEEPTRGPQPIDENSTPANGGPGWLGWFSRSTGEPEKISSSAPPSLRSPDPPLPPPETPTRPSALEIEPLELPPVPGDPRSSPPKRSWLQMWNSGAAKEQNSTAEEVQNEPNHQTPGQSSAAAASAASSSATSGSQVLPGETSAPPTLPGDGSKSAGWVFWSRDRKADNSSTASNEPHVGEIAVSGTPSQKLPKRTSISLPKSEAANPSKNLKIPVEKSSGAAKAREAAALQTIDSRASTPTRATADGQKEGITTPTSAKFPAHFTAAAKQLQVSAPNHLLPSFSETFTPQESPSLFQLLGRLLNYGKPSEDRHLHHVREVPRLKSALAIGVHGYFPAPLIRTVLGQPTGTSIKFADMAAKAIKKWTDSRGYSCEVKTAALEGEGRIAERVDVLWKLLLNWIDEIRKADFVMIACHSQGVPVAMMLVAKLVSFGCVNSAKVGICAMAGVSLGPFPDYRSRWISGSAGELFEFSNSSSAVSKDYLAAVETVLKFGVRVVYIGSIDDQLVSLESSTFSPISHPHIYRAVFVDGRIHAPNFLVHLVGFALKLRNLGVQDHGLIRELSGPLAGSLYTGEGHSRIYEDNAVYDLAVEFALETNAILNAPLSQKPSPSPSSNPYILPWAVRGILEEDFVKSDLHDEAHELLKQFDNWNPTTKVLKDVKFRLEGIRSKL